MIVGTPTHKHTQRGPILCQTKIQKWFIVLNFIREDFFSRRFASRGRSWYLQSFTLAKPIAHRFGLVHQIGVFRATRRSAKRQNTMDHSTNYLKRRYGTKETSDNKNWDHCLFLIYTIFSSRGSVRIIKEENRHRLWPIPCPFIVINRRY